MNDKNQAGIASLLFTLVMMIVISLIVLAFAQLARRGQGETLDSQLSSQAYYAAESGVNDAEQAIGYISAHDPAGLNNTGCAASGDYQTYFSTNGISPQLNSTNDVDYNCLSVNAEPGSLTGGLSTNQSTEFTLDPIGAAARFRLTWVPATSAPLANCQLSTSTNFPPTSNCPFAVIRIDLVPTSGNLSRSGLLSSTLTAFLVPSTDSPSGMFAYSNGIRVSQGFRVPAQCTATLCTAIITGLPGATTYAMRAISLYQSVPNGGFTITAHTSGGGLLDFANGQAVIDVTGQAQDVTRRVEVRMPLNASGGYADYAIQSRLSICKRFGVASGYFADGSGGACTTTSP